jgi:hypothetical protein
LTNGLQTLKPMLPPKFVAYLDYQNVVLKGQPFADAAGSIELTQ